MFAPHRPFRFYAKRHLGALVLALSMVFVGASPSWAQSVNRAQHFQSSIATVKDLATWLRATHQEGRVAVLFFSRRDCPYCHKVEKLYLLPLIHAGLSAHSVAVRVARVAVDDNRPIKGLFGEISSSSQVYAQFHSAKQALLVPMVVVLGADGQSVGTPLLGTMLDDFYQSYLDALLAQASAKSATQ